ncbi:MAG: hypothetical protein ABIA59_10730 [Candidatus Latescibacterota bacterium]
MQLINKKHIFAIALALAFACPPSSYAYKVVGKVTNGTTARTDVAADIELINPRGGMNVEQKLRAANGSFVIDNLSDTSHVYVIRTVYQGISYPGIVRHGDSDTTFFEITVYDTTSLFAAPRVSIPHLMIRKIEEHYRFEIIYEIVNDAEPPKTITGNPFKIYIPEERASLNALYTTELSLPINKEPIATSIKGIYRIDAPLKPGATRVALSFDVHAHDGSYEYLQVLPYDLQSVNIIVEDPAIEVTSGHIALEPSEGGHVGPALIASSLPRSSIFAFRVAGGAAAGAAESSASQKTSVVTQSQATKGHSVPVIIITTLFLLSLPLLSSKKPAVAASRGNILQSQKQRLTAQIAKLDDLYATGTVTDRLYQAKRAELKQNLAHVIRRADGPGGNPSGKAKRTPQ